DLRAGVWHRPDRHASFVRRRIRIIVSYAVHDTDRLERRAEVGDSAGGGWSRGARSGRCLKYDYARITICGIKGWEVRQLRTSIEHNQLQDYPQVARGSDGCDTYCPEDWLNRRLWPVVSIVCIPRDLVRAVVHPVGVEDRVQERGVLRN